MSNATVPRCSRCSSELSEGSTYCIACGHTNVEHTSERAAEIELELDNRREQLSWFRRIANMLFIGRFIFR